MCTKIALLGHSALFKVFLVHYLSSHQVQSFWNILRDKGESSPGKFGMAHAHISANLPPDIDPTKAPIAFGKRALPKLNEELQSPELLTQQRALMALCDLVHDPENIYQAIELGK